MNPAGPTIAMDSAERTPGKTPLRRGEIEPSQYPQAACTGVSIDLDGLHLGNPRMIRVIQFEHTQRVV